MIVSINTVRMFMRLMIERFVIIELREKTIWRRICCINKINFNILDECVTRVFFSYFTNRIVFNFVWTHILQMYIGKVLERRVSNVFRLLKQNEFVYTSCEVISRLFDLNGCIFPHLLQFSSFFSHEMKPDIWVRLSN